MLQCYAPKSIYQDGDVKRGQSESWGIACQLYTQLFKRIFHSLVCHQPATNYVWCMRSMMLVMFSIRRTQRRDDVTSQGARPLTYIRDIPPHLTLVHGILQIFLTVLPGAYTSACQKDWHAQTSDTFKHKKKKGKKCSFLGIYLTSC